jgi:5'-3' exonuclease
MPQPLLLADTPHLLYRAFFALPDSIKGADGRPINALLGSVNQLLWCVERYDPRAVVCCFGLLIGCCRKNGMIVSSSSDRLRTTYR